MEESSSNTENSGNSSSNPNDEGGIKATKSQEKEIKK